MARPKKKPGYDREAEIADLIATAAALFDIPYDDRIPRPEEAPVITATLPFKSNIHYPSYINYYTFYYF